MKRHATFCGYPIRVGEVRLVDDQRITVPVSYCVSAVRRRHIVTVFPSIGRDNLESVVGFRQHDHELRSLDDLTNGANAEQTDIQGTKGHRYASQRRVILVSQSLHLL